MKTHAWLPAAGLLMFGGMAAAQQGEVREETREAREEMQEAGEETREAIEAAGRAAAGTAEQAGRTAGQVIGQGIEEGARVLTGQESPQPRGILSDGDRVRNTLTTNAVGLVLGDGLNATYARSLSEKFSGLVTARYSRARVPDGAVTGFGLNGGVDWYMIGQHNEGLRLGPRLELGVGGETIGEDTDGFAGIGAAGELGYDWIASNGLTAGAALGLRTVLGGELAPGGDRDEGWSPYAKLNLGFSW
jgi:hypothetical protein